MLPPKKEAPRQWQQHMFEDSGNHLVYANHLSFGEGSDTKIIYVAILVYQDSIWGCCTAKQVVSPCLAVH